MLGLVEQDRLQEILMRGNMPNLQKMKEINNEKL